MSPFPISSCKDTPSSVRGIDLGQASTTYLASRIIGRSIQGYERANVEKVPLTFFDIIQASTTRRLFAAHQASLAIQENNSAAIHGNVKARSSHLKSEPITKLVITIQPIDASPETQITAIAPGFPVLKLVADI